MKRRIFSYCLLLLTALMAGIFTGCAGRAPDLTQDDAQSPSALVRLVDTAAVPPLGSAPPTDVFLAPSAPGEVVKNNGKALFDLSNAEDGYIMIRYLEKNTSAKLKVQITGPSGTKYTYNLRNDGEYEVYPLSDGNGSYMIGAYKNITGTRYSVLQTLKTDVSLTDEFAPFIRPNQYVNFSEDSAVVSLAKELIGTETDMLKKVGAIYTYVVENFSYDKELAATVKSGYLPDVDQVLERKKGICFDYAAVMAAMLRSQRIPCKLVIGYAGEEYHAWINVYSEESGWIEEIIFFDGKNWRLMDPTFASGGASAEYIDSKVTYSAKFLY
jgi:hypothetical protein